LEFWRLQIDLEENWRIDSLDKLQICHISYVLTVAEIHLSECHFALGNMDKAENHRNLAIACGRRIQEKEERIISLYDTLIRKRQSLRFQSKDSEALAVFKEAGNEVEASSAYHLWLSRLNS
jgi:hypothetical protein